MDLSKKSWFKFVVIGVILLIPFMYAFFYLKAYWNPYGEGNMDNIPVAIVNLDSGDKGTLFAQKLIDSGKLDFSVTDSGDANDGLSNKKYYAVITIPSNFTKNLESANTDDKTPATITYSPNQKTNYLASQIISRVLVVAEEEIRGEVSSTIIRSLSEKLNEVPEKMLELSDGASKLEDGAKKLSDGISTLNSKYQEFDSGINSLYNGSVILSNGLTEVDGGISSLHDGASSLDGGVKQINDALANVDISGIDVLTRGITSLNDGVNGDSGLVNGVNSYVDGTQSLSNGVLVLNSTIDSLIADYNNAYLNSNDDITKANLQGTIGALQMIKQSINNPNSSMVDGAKVLSMQGDVLKNGINSVGTGVSSLYNSTGDIMAVGANMNSLKENLNKVEFGIGSLNNGISKLSDGIGSLNSGSKSLNSGLSVLNSSSSQIKNAIGILDSGSSELEDGIDFLKVSVDNSINSSKDELSKLDGLDDFAAKSVTIDEVPVNEINSYGTAFGPFFMSIALWVGSLMLFIILYYDKDERFKLLGNNAKNKLLRTGCYLGLAILQGVSLGVLLMIGLDFAITNYFLYFISLILVACLFESIMEFLIVNFGDVGKFISLILLVLQLAAAGGTFPIQTVTKGFRFLNPLLPMTYTCNLFKEAIISIEKGLLTQSLVVIVILFILFLILNIFKDVKEDRI